MKLSLKNHNFRLTMIMCFVAMQASVHFAFPDMADLWYIWAPVLIFVFYIFYLEYINNPEDKTAESD
jgi:hypothetical protein